MVFHCPRFLSPSLHRTFPPAAERHHPDSPTRRAACACASRRTSLAPEKKRNRGKNGNIACMLQRYNPLRRAGAPTLSGNHSGNIFGNHSGNIFAAPPLPRTGEERPQAGVAALPVTPAKNRQHLRQRFRQRFGQRFRQGDAHARHTATGTQHRPKPHRKPTQPTQQRAHLRSRGNPGKNPTISSATFRQYLRQHLRQQIRQHIRRAAPFLK